MGIENEADVTMTENLDTSPTEQIENPVETEGGEVEGEGVAAQGIKAAKWQPDYRFKTRDERREFDDWVKPLISSKESEDKFRDLFERAHGLEVVTGDRDFLREHNAELMESANESSQIKAELGEIGDLFRSGNVIGVEAAFERLQIPDEVIFKYALHKLKLQEATPEAQQAYGEQRKRFDEFSQMQEQNQFLQSQFSQFQVDKRASDIENTLSSPDIAETVSSFDRRAGYKGAFQDAVIKEGRYHYLTTKEDLPVREAVQRVLGIAGPVTTPQNFNRNAGVNVVTSSNQRHPTMPSSRGSGASPVKKVPRSIADLRRLQGELAAAE